MSRAAFQKLYRQPVQDWQPSTLHDLTAKELAAICELLGISASGTKAARKGRIWQARQIRLVVTGYPSDQDGVEKLAANYRADELLALCRAAGAYAGSTKYARAAALLQWRDTCRLRGLEALAVAKAERARRPRQSRLFKE
jgi:hypothetical protein